MSKTIIWLVVGGVALLSGYFILNTNKAEVASNMVADQGTQTGAKKIAFSQFLGQGGTYKCTVHQSVNGMDTQGVTYLDGGLIRGEYTTEIEDVDVSSTFIVRDGYTYSWSSVTPEQGFKVKAQAQGVSTGGSASGSYGWNAEQVGDYNCEAWAADPSKFTVPTNITFQEIGN